MFIAVAPSLGILTLPELIARAKKAPGEITYATTGVGRLTHLTGELLQREAGIKLQVVPYTGGPSHAVTDVATGRVAMIIEGYSGIAGAARSGSIKLIAVASAKRLAEFPDVPTVAETIPDFQATGWAVLVAPIGTSEAIMEKITLPPPPIDRTRGARDMVGRWLTTRIAPIPLLSSSSRRSYVGRSSL
jgi:tripartite-type tricarboxylate transporter receptor subunit TctC